jgi:hypothetical protein
MNVKGISAQHISQHYLPGRDPILIEQRMMQLSKDQQEKQEKQKKEKEKDSEPKLDKKTSAAIKEFTMQQDDEINNFSDDFENNGNGIIDQKEKKSKKKDKEPT